MAVITIIESYTSKPCNNCSKATKIFTDVPKPLTSILCWRLIGFCLGTLREVTGGNEAPVEANAAKKKHSESQG